MRKVRLPSSPAPAEHGRYIYAYCNVRTKQVVYSLSNTLNSHASIKQLPDLGANNKPNHIRKDLWRPLYTLALPTSHPHTLSQGLDAFQKLREYRKLHELNWTPPPRLSQPYSDADIEYEKRKLEDRGGSKKESVYDVIKRRKRNIRVNVVMDQKANSIADLAAVLLEQEEAGRKSEEKVRRLRTLEREREVREMLAFARQVEAGKVQEMEARIEEIEKRLADAQDVLEGTSRTKLKREAYQLGATKTRMVFAAKAVQDARDAMERDGKDIELVQAEEEETLAADAVQSSSLSLLNKPTVQAARKLCKDADAAENGGLSSRDAAILDAQASAAANLDGRSEGAWRAQVRVLRLYRAQMEMAYNATQAENYSGDMVAEAPGIVAKLKQMEFDLLIKDLEEVERRGVNEELLESLREMFAAWERSMEREARGQVSQERQYRKKEVVETAVSEDKTSSETAASSDEAGKETDALTAEEQEPVKEFIDWSSLLPSFPSRKTSTIPKRGHLRQKLKRLNTPIFSTEGIKVKWHNVLDAEFASAWPANVEHERMGWSKYSAPRGDAPAVHDVGEWREMRMSKAWGRKVGEMAEGGEVAAEEMGGGGRDAFVRVRAEREARRQFVEGVESEVLTRVRELDVLRERGRRFRMGLDRGGEGEKRVEV